jgi:hypothetical protein
VVAISEDQLNRDPSDLAMLVGTFKRALEDEYQDTVNAYYARYPDKVEEEFTGEGHDLLEWRVRLGSLDAGDIGAFVGTQVQGEFLLVRLDECKWDAADFKASEDDGRFFDVDTCEPKRVVESNPQWGEASLAYVARGKVYNPETGQKEMYKINRGVLRSLERDWGIRTMEITTQYDYARDFAASCRRWAHVPTNKAASLPSARDIPLYRMQERFIGTLFGSMKKAAAALAEYERPLNVLGVLQDCPLTKKGNPSPVYVKANFGGMGIAAASVATARKRLMAAYEPPAEEEQPDGEYTVWEQCPLCKQEHYVSPATGACKACDGVVE